MATTSRKVLREQIKANWMERIASFLTDEEVLQVASNELAIPVVDAEGNEDWLVITLKVPTGSRDGEAYDGYSMAEDYTMKCAEKRAKTEEAAKKKAEKIAKDAASRKAKAEAKTKAKAEKE